MYTHININVWRYVHDFFFFFFIREWFWIEELIILIRYNIMKNDWKIIIDHFNNVFQ